MRLDLGIFMVDTVQSGQAGLRQTIIVIIVRCDHGDRYFPVEMAMDSGCMQHATCKGFDRMISFSLRFALFVSCLETGQPASSGFGEEERAWLVYPR